MVLSLVSVLVFTVLPIVLVVWAVRHAGHRQGGGVSDGRSVRRFFQYVVLYGLMIVVGAGLSGLLGLPLEEARLAGDDRAVLARALTFSLFGTPMFVAAAVWTGRRLRADPDEAASLGWAAYLTAAPLTSLLVAMTALHGVVSAGLQGDGLDGRSLVTFVVWTALWVAHWLASQRLLAPERRQVHLLLGSLIGLVASVAGLVQLLGAAVTTLLVDGSGALASSGPVPLATGAATVLAGVPVWIVYWLGGLSRPSRTPLWLAYVLPAGVGGSLVLGVVGASLTLYEVLVWFVGEPEWTSAADHFRGVPTAAACVLVGAMSWWYHRAVLTSSASAGTEVTRTEVTRVYEYLMAGVALLAAAVGVTLVLIAVVESFAPAAVVEVGASPVNSLLAGVTLLVVGGPLWWLYWSRILRGARARALAELVSPTRRIYLFALFGVGGVAAVIAVLAAAFIGIEGALQDGFGLEVLREMRVPLGILVATAAVSGYHWTVYKQDRARTPAIVATSHAPRYVLLIGAPDQQARSEVARRTGAQVELWARADGLAGPWVVDDVVEAIAHSGGADAVTVIAGGSYLESIPMAPR